MTFIAGGSEWAARSLYGMKILLAITAVVEAATGVALLLSPPLIASLAAMADAARCAAERPSRYASGLLSSNRRAIATARARLASAKE